MCPSYILFEVPMKKETKYQRDVVNKIRTLFPGCVALRTDPTQLQGIPDVLVLYKDRWAMLEFKKSANEPTRPNQEYRVEEFRQMSYASFIFPENEERVLRELQQALGSRRKTRISES